jgi:hypothetical protein
VILVLADPSPRIVQMSQFKVPEYVRQAWYAIRVPSGDHLGAPAVSLPERKVSCRLWVPSGSIFQMLPSRTNAIFPLTPG